MKILFLDVDGVLNSDASLNRMYPGYRFIDEVVDPEHVRYLNDIVERSGAKVVISSTWRLYFPLPRMREILAAAGFRGEVVGETPNLFDKTRGLEIAAWCFKNEHLDGEPVTHWVVLDDNPIGDDHADRLVRTEFETGLCAEHVPLALRHLGVEV